MDARATAVTGVEGKNDASRKVSDERSSTTRAVGDVHARLGQRTGEQWRSGDVALPGQLDDRVVDPRPHVDIERPLNELGPRHRRNRTFIED